MYRFRLSLILLCGLMSTVFLGSFAPAQNSDKAAPRASQRPIPDTPTVPLRFGISYLKWLDEDVRYIITDQERADFDKLTTDQQRDKFVEDFWERRNPNPGSVENEFKEEHYRRIVYTNQHFAAGDAGWETDRGRIYILYGPPDEREQHPGRTEGIPADAPLSLRYPSDVWRYHILKGVGQDVIFEFIDSCRCGGYRLVHDPTQKHTQSGKELINWKELISIGAGPPTRI